MKTGAQDKAEQIGLKGKASRQDLFKQKSDWGGVCLVFLTVMLHVFSKRDNSVLSFE